MELPGVAHAPLLEPVDNVKNTPDRRRLARGGITRHGLIQSRVEQRFDASLIASIVAHPRRQITSNLKPSVLPTAIRPRDVRVFPARRRSIQA